VHLAERVLFSSPGDFKPRGREDPGDFHPIINAWGGIWVIPRPGEGSP
jgi:hypothetical protein